MNEASKFPTGDDEVIRAKRRQIFLAVTRVLARKSFHQATVKEMAQEAGIAAGSIYMYLRSKDEIVLLRAELLAIMRVVLSVIDRYREAFAVLNHEVRYFEKNTQYRVAMREVLRPYKESLASALERGRARG